MTIVKYDFLFAFVKMTSSLSVKRTMPLVQKRIDNFTQLFPPLDYSFHNAQKLEDATAAEPRVASHAPAVVKEGDQYRSYGLNFNHNSLGGQLQTLPDIVRTLLVEPYKLASLDLSFNLFSEIPAVIAQFESLKYLYFHKNLLEDVAEVQKLLPLKELKYLTLHGNPIEIKVPHLRSYVLFLLPGLRSLNCTPVTKGDLKTSDVWGHMNSNLFPKYLTSRPKK